MAVFRWDEQAVIAFFGVLPTESHEYGRDLAFQLSVGSLSLVFGVNVDTSDCSVLLCVDGIETPVFKAVYLGSPGARFVEEKNGRVMELGAPRSFAGRHDGEQPFTQGLRIRLQPHIAVSHFVA